MQTSQNHEISYGSDRFYVEPVQNLESYCLPSIENLDNYSSSDNSCQTFYPSHQTLEPYNTLESASTSNNSLPYQNSPSTHSFSPNNSPGSTLRPQHSLEFVNGSPEEEDSYLIYHDHDDLRHKMSELESVMRGPNVEMLEMYDTKVQEESASFLLEAEKWKKNVEMVSRGDLKEMLYTCAKAVDENDIETIEWMVTELRKIVSVSGSPIERLGAYMLEALVSKIASSGSTIYKSLKCSEPTGNELLSYMHVLYEICPYFKFGYMSANGAIAEAMKEENEVHIIDFQIGQGTQWVSLIQALARRPGGPPKIRITGIDDSYSSNVRGGGVDIVGEKLLTLAQSCHVPFEFHAVRVYPSEVRLEDFELRPNEAVAVNFAIMLHHVPDESVNIHNHRDRLLRLAKHMSPKVVTLVEQEFNTNNAPFLQRFLETMNYYSAVYESIDVVLPRDHKERINVEQHCLAREVVNLVACEGEERVERHELLSKWRMRFTMAGFTPYPLSSFINSSIKNLLESYRGHYTLEERDGALFLGWMNQDLIASCAWR
ncbi:putative transcription factor GRAS family [Medicago truncatula]|uniref:GRAS family transcription factor n=1 Tax=Medicago truncatula TaxID=3880 RepID=G7J211_MEDTR|nr:scarecrow-like protein 21 [Medicago truncatula]XP_024635367.1 scarecrow-like protein 21 [Medicago truncatula]AES70512.1 GRAS family transcription factor [Medicago truncatula]RHN67284.1 putative transcription factor GRAS family [Medicago truncatula]